MLRLKNVSKAFRGIPALSDVSLEVAKGEIHTILGQNGAGKSTLAKIITGALQRDSGEVFLDGRAVDFRSPHEAQAAGVGVIYQEINLLPKLSVADNIFMGRELMSGPRLDWNAMQKRSRASLQAFGLDIDVTAPLAQYSLAIQQMIAIARATDSGGQLLILDEPTSSLDNEEVTKLFSVLTALKQQGKSMIFVSHRLDELYAICDRVTVMRDGRSILSADLASVSRDDLVTTMLGRSLASQQPREAVSDAELGDSPILDASSIVSKPRLKSADLKLFKGHIGGIAGLLGSGRTETLQSIFGLRRRDSGTIKLDGRIVELLTPANAVEHKLAYCSEDRKTEGLFLDMSIEDNLGMVILPDISRAGVVNRRKLREIALKYIDLLSIKCTGPRQRIGELSGGNQQKVLLARWMCVNPQVFLLDEPTRGVDVLAKQQIRDALLSMTETGAAIAVVSSEVEELVQLCSRIMVLVDGQTKAVVDPSQTSNQQILSMLAH